MTDRAKEEMVNERKDHKAEIGVDEYAKIVQEMKGYPIRVICWFYCHCRLCGGYMPPGSKGHASNSFYLSAHVECVEAG